MNCVVVLEWNSCLAATLPTNTVLLLARQGPHFTNRTNLRFL